MMGDFFVSTLASELIKHKPMTHYTTPMPHWLIRLLHVARRIFPRPNPKSGLPIFPIGLTQFPKWANPFPKMGSPNFSACF